MRRLDEAKRRENHGCLRYLPGKFKKSKGRILRSGRKFIFKRRYVFEKKRADILIVSTMDEYHKDHAIRGMELGYDILLEKPVAPTMEECLAILEAGKSTVGI